jgi:hypothetical protein
VSFITPDRSIHQDPALPLPQSPLVSGEGGDIDGYTPFSLPEVRNLEKRVISLCPSQRNRDLALNDMDIHCPNSGDISTTSPVTTINDSGETMEIYSFHAQENTNEYITRNENLITYGLLATKTDDDPPSFKHAMRSAQKSHWIKAAQEEMASLIKHGTWSLVPRPQGCKPLKTKWVFKTKLKADGSIDRYKARLVAKGYLQQAGIDYDEIFSPVVRMEVLRLLLAIAATFNLECEQMDVDTAFLNGIIDMLIHIEQPEGFIIPGKEDFILLLHKALYGLKQSPKLWYDTISKFLLDNGFHQIHKDRCVFIKVI